MTTTTKPLSTWTVADGLAVIQSLGDYLDEPTRLAITVNAQSIALSSVDLGRACRQQDTGAFWVLTQISPIRFDLLAGPIPVRPQAGAGTYTAVLADHGALVPMTSGSATAPTIPPNSSVAFQIGDSIMFQQQGAGLMTLTAGAGVTFEGTSFVSSGVGSVLVATKRLVNTWVIYGKTT